MSLNNHKSREQVISIGNEEITGSKSVKLLGVTIGNKLNFSEHVTKICNKANQKLHAHWQEFFFFFFMHFFSGTKHPREDNPNLYYWAEMAGVHTQTFNI